MARVKVTTETTIAATPSVNVLYPEGYEGPAPDDHIEQIVGIGHGERLSARGDLVAALPDAPAAAAAGDAPHDA